MAGQILLGLFRMHVYTAESERGDLLGHTKKNYGLNKQLAKATNNVTRGTSIYYLYITYHKDFGPLFSHLTTFYARSGQAKACSRHHTKNNGSPSYGMHTAYLAGQIGTSVVLYARVRRKPATRSTTIIIKSNWPGGQGGNKSPPQITRFQFPPTHPPIDTDS